MTRKTVSTLLAAGLLASGLSTLTPKPAQAGADGRRNTTIALGAAAVYELLQHKTTNALILGAGTAYAEKQYENARSNERSQNNDRRYYRSGGYGGGNNRNYNNGGYYDNNGRYQNSGSYDRNNGQYGNGDYERHTDGGHDSDNRDRYDNDNRDRDNRTDQHGQHRGWDGRALPPGQNRDRNDDRQ